jgi:hypothetical protein
MHKKKVVILRILAQESPKSEVRLQRYGLWKLFGGKMVFLGGFLGFFLKFWEWLDGLGTKDRPLAKCENFFGDFWVNFWGFWSG